MLSFHLVMMMMMRRCDVTMTAFLFSTYTALPLCTDVLSMMILLHHHVSSLQIINLISFQMFLLVLLFSTTDLSGLLLLMFQLFSDVLFQSNSK